MSKQNELAQLADVVTVDGSNVGIGVVPKTWNVYDQAVQIGDGAAIWTYQNAEAHYSVNSYYNSGNKYIGTGTALQYQQAAGAHSFKTATSGTANAAISWNTKVNIDSDGLKFNGDTAATNALNDYEEGTFTATLIGATSAPNSAQTTTGNYTKVGRLVTYSINFVNKDTTGASGGLKITGLPFTAAHSGFGSYISYGVANYHADAVNTAAWNSAGTTEISFYDNRDEGIWDTTLIVAGNTKYLYLSITAMTQ